MQCPRTMDNDYFPTVELNYLKSLADPGFMGTFNIYLTRFVSKLTIPSGSF